MRCESALVRCCTGFGALAFWTVTTAIVAAAIAVAASSFTWLAAFLGWPFLAWFASFAAAHGCGHGCLIGQCQILLYGIAGNAFTAFSALTPFAARTLAAVGIAAGFRTRLTRLAWFTYFAWLTWLPTFAALVFIACCTFCAGFSNGAFLAFGTRAFDAAFRIALAALAATAAFCTDITATIGATFRPAFTAAFTATFRPTFWASLSTALATRLVAAATATSTIPAGAFTALCAASVRPAIATCFSVVFVLFHVACGRRGRRWRCAKQVLDPAEEAFFHRRCGHGCRRAGGCFCCRNGHLRLGNSYRRRCIRQHAFDDRLLLVVLFLAAARDQGRVLDLFSHLVAGFNVVQPRVVVLQALQLVVRRFQCFVRHQQHIDALLHFNFADLRALFVQQERRHIDRDLAQHRSRAVFQRLFLDDAQNLQCRAFGVADMAGTTAARARDGRAFGQSRAQPLAAHFHQTEFADGAKLNTRAVLAQRIAQTVFNIAAVARLFHVDEVNDDQAAQVTQAHLARDFVGGFQVGAGGGFFNVAALDGAGRVDVNGHQGFGVVDNDSAAGWQLHGAGIGRLDLVLDLEAAEQRRIVAVALDAVLMLGHDVGHELARLLVDVVGVEQNIADVAVEVIADRADHEARFLVNQESALAALASAFNGRPQLDQVVQVPLQLGGAAADAGGTRDDAGAGRVFQLVHGFLELGPVIAFNAAAHATTTRVVRHQHHIAAGQ